MPWQPANRHHRVCAQSVPSRPIRPACMPPQSPMASTAQAAAIAILRTRRCRIRTRLLRFTGLTSPAPAARAMRRSRPSSTAAFTGWLQPTASRTLPSARTVMANIASWLLARKAHRCRRPISRFVCAGHATQICGSGEKYGLDAEQVPSYEDSFHGLAARGGVQKVANCASCHGVHNILPSSDPDSYIHPDNLAETCGKCHVGAGTQFAIGPVHLLADQEPNVVAYWIRLFIFR